MPEHHAHSDNANTLVRPPFALLFAFVSGLVLDWFFPLRFLPAAIPAALLGGLTFLAGLSLAAWAIAAFRAAGTRVETYRPSSAIVAHGPYRFTRNPIYMGMFLALAGMAIAFNTLWLLATLLIFFVVIRFGVVAREEAYLERKFGDSYRAYKTRVRRWA